MKKIILSLIIVICTLSVGYSQNAWFWQNPLPQGNMLFGTKFFDANTGFFTGECGTIMKTVDGGQTYTLINSGTTIELNSVFFINTTTGYIAGGTIGGSKNANDGLILKSIDGGNSWTTLISGLSPLFGIYFLDLNTGYVTGYGGLIMKTTNGGANWLPLSSSTSAALWGISFVNSQTGYITGGDFNPNNKDYVGGLILKTSNAGGTWTQMISGLPYPLFGIQFISSVVGYACGPGTVLKAINEGTNWTIIPTGYSNKFFFGLNVFDANTLIVHGGKMDDGGGAIIIKTTNGGTNWTSQLSGSDTNSFYVVNSFVNANTGYVAGEHGKILKTVNGGNNWTSLSYSAVDYEITKIFFSNEYGYGISRRYNDDKGTFDKSITFATSNGGTNWLSKCVMPDIELFDVCILTGGTGYMVGAHNAIFTFDTAIVFKTTNYGDNWTRIYQESNVGVFTLYFADANTGYTFGWGNMNRKTTNGGNSWTPLNIPLFNDIRSCSFVNVNTGYVVTWNGDVAKTTDGGNSWISAGNIGFTGGYDRSIFAVDANTVYSVSDTCFLAKTTNGGNNWTVYTFPSVFRAASVCFPTLNNGFVCGEDDNPSGPDVSKIYLTTNAGLNWILSSSPSSRKLRTLSFISATTGYAAGDRGIILKTTNGGQIWINKISSVVPSEFILEQNYPNPFNPNTIIRYHVKENTDVIIKIYDILGKEITTLVNEKHSPGIYEVDWNALNCSSGIYFYRLETKNYTETKKMMLVK